MISYLYSYNDFSTELVLNLMEPMTLAGAIVGGALPFLFSGILIEAVAKAARSIHHTSSAMTGCWNVWRKSAEKWTVSR